MELYEYIEAKTTSHKRGAYVKIVDELNNASRFFGSDFIITTSAHWPVAANEIVTQWFMDEYNSDNQPNVVKWLLSICDIDDDWTKKRNGLYLYPLFYKVRLKKDACDFITEHIAKAVEYFEPLMRAETLTNLNDGWHRVKVIELKSPEKNGKGGYLEAIYENGKGERIQMVYTEIPDLCLYPVPARLKNSPKRIIRKEWSESERELAVWMTKNEDFY